MGGGGGEITEEVLLLILRKICSYMFMKYSNIPTVVVILYLGSYRISQIRSTGTDSVLMIPMH